MGDLLLSDAGPGGDNNPSGESCTSSIMKRVLDKHGYTMKKDLGKGMSGRLFLVEDTDGDPYVIKQLNSRDSSEQAKVQNEVKILEKINCGYIVTYVKSFEDKEAGLYYIVMEYCEGGDLFKKMQTQKDNGIFEEKQIIDWLIQMCLALQYIHDERRNVFHRDIKPQNFFLSEDGYIILGDFGYSKILQRYDVYSSSFRGADLYTCPEVHENKKYTSKSDIYSMGWLLYDLCMLDVWSQIAKRRFQQASHNMGYHIDFSEIYSDDLQELIKEMITLDPETRPSADEILAKPFLRDAVKINKRIPEALERRFSESFKAFDKAYNENFENFDALVKEWGETTTALEETHRKCTIGSLSGSVMGAAGGITAIVGLVLAPFTFGASVIVSGVGIGVGLAGGLTGAGSSIANARRQKPLRNNIEKLQQNFEKVSTPILNSLNTLRKVLRTVQKFKDFVSDSSDNVKMLCNVNKRRGACATELMNLALLANIGRIVAQTARVGRAAVVALAAVSGVLSGLLVIVDAALIAVDSADIHQMRKGKIDDPEKVRSNLLKSIAQMRKTHTDLLDVLVQIKEAREELNEYTVETAKAEI